MRPPGNVGVATRLQAVQHPDGGLVAALRVRDGERVAAGAAILELDASELSSEEAVVTRQLHEARARIDRLSAEARSQDALAFRDGRAAMDSPVLAALLAAERRLFETGRETLIKTLGQIGERKTQTAAYIDGLQRQIEAVGDQLELIGAEARDKQSLLDRKLIKRSEVSRLRREEARLKGDLGRLQADVARARSAIASYEMERLRLLAERRERAQGQMRELQPREAELAERLRVIERRLSRRVLRAPMAGVVHALEAATGTAATTAIRPCPAPSGRRPARRRLRRPVRAHSSRRRTSRRSAAHRATTASTGMTARTTFTAATATTALKATGNIIPITGLV